MIFTNKLEHLRIEKSNQLNSLGVDPYPHNITRDLTIKEFLKHFEYVKELEDKRDPSQEKTVVGRIKFLRLMGKAVFAKIEDESGILQIYYNKNSLGDEWFKSVKKLIEVGDIIQVRGFAFITKTGELSLNVQELKLVTKAIKPLPEKFHGLQDKELRYRQRYLDMIMNPEIKNIFKTRSKIVAIIRDFFQKKGFLEIETPMMHPIAGGANAKAFKTHHNALGVDRYLRIAPELYLKRVIVGGFEAVFEINRNFRNEGMDHTHNPEFTMLEFYWAYHNYNDLMNLTQELIIKLLHDLNLPQKLQYGDFMIDFKTPFKRIKYFDSMSEIGGISKDILQDSKKIVEFLDKNDIKVDPKLPLIKLWDELFDNFVEPKLIDPTFITHYPIEISPLARRSKDDPNIAERFEFFIAGFEIANGFNELNDPLDQYERFKKQIENKNAGDDEAHEMDEEYIHAIGYGMPPTAGEGIGIDRLTMILTNQHSIRDVILFPAMKPIKKQDEIKEDK